MRLPPSQLPFHSFFNLPYEYFNQSFCLNLPKRVFSLNSNVLIKIPPSKNQWQQILTHQKQCRPVSPKSQAINALHLNHCRPTNIITNGGRKSERECGYFIVSKFQIFKFVFLFLYRHFYQPELHMHDLNLNSSFFFFSLSFKCFS